MLADPIDNQVKRTKRALAAKVGRGGSREQAEVEISHVRQPKHGLIGHLAGSVHYDPRERSSLE
jgi:hypothetical protein